MSDIAIEKPADARKLRPYIIWAIIIAVGALGIALKEQFGLFMMHVLGKPAPGPQNMWQFLFKSEWGWLCLAALGSLLFYQYAGFKPAPALERLLFRDTRKLEKPRIWLPALLGGLVCTLFFAVHLALGFQAPLTQQMGAGHMAHADQVKLMMLYPLALIGAPISEEPLFRFGVMMTLMGILSFVRRGDNSTNFAIFWIANIVQAAFFGFVHVQQGAVTSQAGGLLLQTLISPPTWSGLTLGYVFRRWGIESAIVAHFAADLFTPILLAIVGALHL